MNASGLVYLAQGYFGIKRKPPRIKPPTFLDLLSHLTKDNSSQLSLPIEGSNPSSETVQHSGAKLYNFHVYTMNASQE